MTGRKGVGEATLSFQDQTVSIQLIEQALGELRGQLLENGGANAIPGAEVTFFPKDSLEVTRRVTTGPDGSFFFPAIAAGPFQLQGSHPTDHRSATISGTFPSDGSSLTLNLILPAKYFPSSDMSQHFRHHSKILSLLRTRNRLYNSPRLRSLNC